MSVSKLLGITQMTATSFYTPDELAKLGFGAYGVDVRISRKASFYRCDQIFIGSHVRIDDFSVLCAGEEGIRLGNYIHIGCFCALHGASGIVMEDFTGLSARTVLYSETDDFSGQSLAFPMIPERFKPTYRRGKIMLRRHAIVGTNATIMPGVVLAEGAAVGAYTLVLKDCDAWSIYVGVPASRLKERSRALLDLEAAFLLEQSMNPSATA